MFRSSYVYVLALPVADVGTLVCGDVAHMSLHAGVALNRKSILLQVD